MGSLQEGLQNIAPKLGMEISSNIKEEPKNMKKAKRHLWNVLPTRKEANAPYNFIPLNKSPAVSAEPLPENDKYHDDDRLTGYIDCNLETLTPIYIRGCLTEAEVKDGKEAKDKSDFFSPNGGIRIPGSSLRGMIRTLVEIVSWGKFGFFEDRGLYYRGLADITNLRKEYQTHMSSFDRKEKTAIYKMNAGYLNKSGFNYFIIPAKMEDGRQFCQIRKDYARKECGSSYGTFKCFPLSDGRYIVVSGNIPNKKKDWLINPPDNKKEISILPEDINQYTRDEDRIKDANLLGKISNYSNGVPCFYVKWTDAKGRDRVSFGHTGMFRLAYEKSIGEHVPDFLQDEDKTDLAETIFGKAAKKGADSFAGRVFFEDAILLNPKENPLMEEAIPKILSTPKPTTFQHYLVQDTDNISRLNHYNSETIIRGNKLYWHKSGENWEEKDTDKINRHKTQYTKIQPVRPETKFKSRIRFENLSEIELGALLFALNLPKGCAHKIGMGKSLGLGSVKITPTLVISDRKERYKSLFDGNSWALPTKDSNGIEYYISVFGKDILSKINPEEKENATLLWDTYRLRQLKVMMDVEKWKALEKQDENKIRYMRIDHPQYRNEFRDRRVLPIPEKVGGGE